VTLRIFTHVLTTAGLGAWLVRAVETEGFIGVFFIWGLTVVELLYILDLTDYNGLEARYDRQATVQDVHGDDSDSGEEDSFVCTSEI